MYLLMAWTIICVFMGRSPLLYILAQIDTKEPLFCEHPTWMVYWKRTIWCIHDDPI